MSKVFSLSVFLLLFAGVIFITASAEETSATEKDEESSTMSLDKGTKDEALTTKEPEPLFSTGSELLDAIMNCPCQQDDLDIVGMQGVKVFGAGHERGERAGSFIGRILRRVISAPGNALTRAVPAITRHIEEHSKQAEKIGERGKGFAARFPKEIDPSKGRKGLVGRVADSARIVAGGLIETVAGVAENAGRTGQTVSSLLPFVGDAAGSVSDAFVRTGRAVFDWVTGIQEIVAEGINSAGRVGGGFVGGVVEGGTDFKTGVLSGITKSLGDEDQ